MITPRRPHSQMVKLVRKDGVWLGYQKYVNPMDEGSAPESYYLIGQPDWKVALAVTENGLVLVRRQWKAGRGGDGEELPASSIEYAGMPDEEVVRRELRDGTGFEAGKVTLLGHVFMATRHSPTKAQCWLVTGCRPTNAPSTQSRERVSIHLVPLRDWVDKVLNGEIDEQSSVVTTFRALPYLGIQLTYPNQR